MGTGGQCVAFHVDEKHAAVFISKIISMRREEISLCRYQIVVLK